MSQLAAPPPPTAAPPFARRPPLLHRPTVLRGVTWAEYRGLREKTENEHVKLTYDGPAGGLLEIEMPLGIEHESLSRLLMAFVLAFARVRGLPIRPVGSVTQSRQDLDRGLEADECFYLKTASQIRGKRRLDLSAGDPPPDLAVEVDVTSPGVSKLPIYAALGVPEVWVWADDAIAVRRLTDDGDYEIVPDSGELPDFPVAAAAALAARWADEDAGTLLGQFEGRLG